MVGSRITGNMLALAGVGVVGSYGASMFKEAADEEEIDNPSVSNPVSFALGGLKGMAQSWAMGELNPYGSGEGPGWGDYFSTYEGLSAGASVAVGLVAGAGTAYAMWPYTSEISGKTIIPSAKEAHNQALERERRDKVPDNYTNEDLKKHWMNEVRKSPGDYAEDVDKMTDEQLDEKFREVYDNSDKDKGDLSVAEKEYRDQKKNSLKSLREKVDVSHIKEGGFLSRNLRAAGNKAAKGFLMGQPAMTGFAVGAAATAALAGRAINQIADQMAAIGTPGSRLASRNMIGARKRVRQSQPTSGVSRYAGSMRNNVDGSMVLALHKTGGRGAVLR